MESIPARDERLFAKVRKFALENGFPEATDALIDRNYSVIASVMEFRDKCKDCNGLEMCQEINKTCGYTMALRIEKNGWMQMIMQPCQKRYNKDTFFGMGQEVPRSERRFYGAYD
ncbi:hypothetical protein [Anaerospora hongkongensis]|uniref:hypothetical protein n=1 Tax=Anaerospora hongkongensis TaxID=244830 RepID=UPI002FDA1159